MPALFLGSIGVLAETSRLQRDAFNAAFREAGLDWHWSEDAYRGMLGDAGGERRIAGYAETRGETVDSVAIHARKSALFQQRLAEGVETRNGVRETLEEARGKGWKTAFVTTTSPANVTAILEATGVARGDFDLILDGDQVAQSKPDPAGYALALSRLGIGAGDAVAVEDNPDGLAAARSAGIPCIAFPGALHDAAAFDGARAVIDRMTMDAIETG